MKLPILTLIVSLIIFSSLSLAASFVYDDFSGSTLDSTKWNITCGDFLGCVPVVGINTTTKTFQIAQPTPHGIGAATATYLNLIGHTFSQGEILQFDVYYSQNIGNQVLGFTYDTLPPAPCFSCIGYWNGVVGDGNLAGHYRFSIKFLSGKQIYVKIRKPDKTIVTRFYNYSTDNPVFYLSAATGHDGILRVDYDNFIIKTPMNKSKI